MASRRRPRPQAAASRRHSTTPCTVRLPARFRARRSFEGLEEGLMQGLVASEPRTDRCQLKTRRCHAFIALCRSLPRNAHVPAQFFGGPHRCHTPLLMRSVVLLSLSSNNTCIVKITLVPVTHVQLEHRSHTPLLAQHRNYGVPVHHDVRELYRALGWARRRRRDALTTHPR